MGKFIAFILAYCLICFAFNLKADSLDNSAPKYDINDCSSVEELYLKGFINRYKYCNAFKDSKGIYQCCGKDANDATCYNALRRNFLGINHTF